MTGYSKSAVVAPGTPFNVTVARGGREITLTLTCVPTPDVWMAARRTQEAAALGNWDACQAAAIDYVSSPLLRARETMELMRAELGLPPRGYRTDDRLREIHYGYWEGELWNELPAKDPQGFAAREADKWGWRPTGGESYRDLSERVAGWLREIERDAVVAAHGGVMRVIRGLILKLQPAKIFLLDVPQDKVLMVEAGHTKWL